MNQPILLYRYESYFIGDEYHRELKFVIDTYEVIRQTPKCYVINHPDDNSKEMKILKSSNGKRYAYDTKEKAYNGYYFRCQRRLVVTRRMFWNSEEIFEKMQDKERLLNIRPR